jgi:hypothetical protein
MDVNKEEIALTKKLILALRSTSRKLEVNSRELRDPRRRLVYARASRDLEQVAEVEQAKLKPLVIRQVRATERKDHYLSYADPTLTEITGSK